MKINLEELLFVALLLRLPSAKNKKLIYQVKNYILLPTFLERSKTADPLILRFRLFLEALLEIVPSTF